MIGNDLECLGDWPVRSASRTSRFRSKIFTSKERKWLDEQADQRLAEVSLWCAKESVYKAWHRMTPVRRFAPKKFAIQIDKLDAHPFFSEVDGWRFHGELWKEDLFVHAIAWRDDIERQVLNYSFHRSRGGAPVENVTKDAFGRPWLAKAERRAVMSISHSRGHLAVLTSSAW